MMSDRPPTDKPCRLAYSGIVDDYSGGTVEFSSMMKRICVGAEQSLLLTGEENEPNRSLRSDSRRLDCPQRINNQSGVASIVQSSRTQFPRIEVRPRMTNSSGFLAAPEFRDNVGSFDCAADLIRNRKIGPHQIARRKESCNTFAIFPGNNHHRQTVDLARHQSSCDGRGCRARASP